MQLLFDETSRRLSEMVRVAVLRHQILSWNIANIDTPGYRPMEVSFSEELRLASEAGTLPTTTVRPTVLADPAAGTGRFDGNAVDLDRQMAKMAENALWHNVLIQILNSRLNFLRIAIRGS
jgi:flagellar basal-body rod protein FlgB